MTKDHEEVWTKDGYMTYKPVFTKVNVRKALMPKVKARAAVQNRTITNYIETLILADIDSSTKH